MSDATGFDPAKLAAANASVRLVEDGMKLGLGTGSTAAVMVEMLARRVEAEGLSLRCAATSKATAEQALSRGLKVESLDDIGWLDMTIDGADEVDPMMSLIKGGGGSLLREKIVATASERMIVIADDSKRVETLGAFPLPVEVVRFGLSATRKLIEDVLSATDLDGSTISPRMVGEGRFVTDEGHYILDLHLEYIDDVDSLAQRLLAVPGVVETGLFVDIADTALFGYASGEVRIQRGDAAPEPVDPPDDGRLERFLAHLEQQG